MLRPVGNTSIKLYTHCILAIIPGPHEPHAGHEMNNVLQPLVEDLEVLNKGMTICGLNIRVRGICWACDLPAMRKVLGMLSHNANKGIIIHYPFVIQGIMVILKSKQALLIIPFTFCRVNCRNNFVDLIAAEDN